jgi:hypothetical protein
MEFEGGLPFAHVLRVLKIIHEVSPSYFIIGVSLNFDSLKSDSDVILLGKLLVLRLSYRRDVKPSIGTKRKQYRQMDRREESKLLRSFHDQGNEPQSVPRDQQPRSGVVQVSSADKPGRLDKDTANGLVSNHMFSSQRSLLTVS